MALVEKLEEEDVKTAICIALNYVGPEYYGGKWDGVLAWPTRDSHKIRKRWEADGFHCISLHNDSATIGAVENTVLAQLRRHNQPDDAVVVHISSHGGQVRDLTGTESDRLCETFCLFNGHLIDKTVSTWAAEVRCRVLIVSDKCHAAGSLRAGPVMWRRAVAPVPLHHAARIVHLAGCSEDGSSMESAPRGGHWTHAVCEAWDVLTAPVALPRTFWQWLRRVPPRTVPRVRPSAVQLGNEASDRLERRAGSWQEPMVEVFGGNFVL